MNEHEEAIELLKSANDIALLLGPNSSWDALGAGLALGRGLEKLGKNLEVFFNAPAGLPSFFLSADLASTREPRQRDFIISFDLKKSPVKELKYERAEDRLKIILSPQNGAITREDVEFGYGPARYDLLVAVASPDLEAIEELVENAPQVLHEQTLLNIDCQTKNSRYGDVNLVDPERFSVSEMMFELLEDLGTMPLDKRSATLLLAGMSSCRRHTTIADIDPKSIRVINALLNSGADAALVKAALRPEPDQHALQLLGRALARSKFDQDSGLLWTALTKEDFHITASGETDLLFVGSELGRFFHQAKTRVLLFQNPSNEREVFSRISSQDPHLAQTFGQTRSFGSFIEARETISALLGADSGVE